MDRPLFALIELSADDGAILSLAKSFSPLDEEIKLRVSATDQVNCCDLFIPNLNVLGWPSRIC